MSFRAKVTALGAVFVVLLALLVVGTVIVPRGGSGRAAAAPLLPGLKPERALAVQVSGPGGVVALSKAAGWTVEADGAQHAVAPDRVEGLLKLLAGLPRGTVVTRDAKAGEGLGLGASEAVRILVTGPAGAKLCDLSVGRQAPTGGSYVRAGEAAEVYQTGEGLSAYLSTERASWLDLRVIPRDVKADMVMRVSVQGTVVPQDAKTPVRLDYTLLKEKDGAGVMAWSFAPAGAKPDQQAVNTMVNALAGMEASDLLPKADPAAAGLASPQAVVTAWLTDNRTIELSFGPRTQAGQYPCGLKGGAAAFLVPEWRVQAVLLARERLTGPAR